jgi:4-hydroxy-tetrahydrodipicolinate synthase
VPPQGGNTIEDDDDNARVDRRAATPFTANLTIYTRCARSTTVKDRGATMAVAAADAGPISALISSRPSTIEFVDRRVPVMVGITHPSFKTSVELATSPRPGAAAVQLGAAASLRGAAHAG